MANFKANQMCIIEQKPEIEYLVKIPMWDKTINWCSVVLISIYLLPHKREEMEFAGEKIKVVVNQKSSLHPRQFLAEKTDAWG